MWSVTQAFLLAWLRWLSEPGSGSPGHGPLYNVYVGLMLQGTPAISPLSTYGIIVEANYGGYARQEVVWYPPWQSTGGAVMLEGGSLYYAPTDSSVSDSVVGAFLIDTPTGNGTLWAGQFMAAPVTMGSPLNALKVLPAIALGYGPNYGGAVFES